MQNSHSSKIANHCSKRKTNVAKFTFIIYGKKKFIYKGKTIMLFTRYTNSNPPIQFSHLVLLNFRASNSPKRNFYTRFLQVSALDGGANKLERCIEISQSSI